MIGPTNAPPEFKTIHVRWITFTSEVQYGGFSSEIATQIPRTIESADAVIADLTNADPNVMYELGFAHALKKPVLPIVQRDSSRIPSDLQGYLFYAYDNPVELVITVERWLYRTFGDRVQ
jgi:Nucleoside 2-deoxyribosyltransferase